MQEITLNNNTKMPILGFGVYQISAGVECEKAVENALDIDYRMIDTAQAYRNEESVGNAIKNSGIDRKELFIITKVWISSSGYEKAKKSIDESLKKLQTDYIDLLLIHQPFGDYYGTYKAMEDGEKKLRAIGVSNFYPDRFIDLTNFVEIKPVVNQVETHVFNQQKRPNEIMKKYNCQIMSWGPFAEGRNNFFTNDTLVNIGKNYDKSSAQVALRFLVQEDIVVIPKSIHRERMEQNFNIFDFNLNENEMNEIRRLDKEESLFFSHYSPETVEMLINVK